MSSSPPRLRTVKVTTCQIDADSGTIHDGRESAPVQSAAVPSGPLAIGLAAASGEQEKVDLRMSDGKTRVAISSKARSPTESLHAGYASCGSRSNKDLAGSSESTPHGIRPWRRKAKSEIVTSKLRWNNHGKKGKAQGRDV